jgi:hypothetical protein
MKLQHLYTIPLIIFLLSYHCLVAQDAADDGFELVREEGDSKLYERWIIFPGSNPPMEAREVKGEFFIKGSVESIIKIIKDETRIKLWQKKVIEYKVYNLTDSTWRAYAKQYIPWPLNNQDHLLHYELQKQEDNSVFIPFKSVVDLEMAPEHKGVNRMTLSGSWLLDPINKGVTKVTYRILSMPMGYPKFIVDPIIRGNLMSTIQSLIEVAEKK